MVFHYARNQITGKFKILHAKTSLHSLGGTSLVQEYDNLKSVYLIPRKWLDRLGSFSGIIGKLTFKGRWGKEVFSWFFSLKLFLIKNF